MLKIVQFEVYVQEKGRWTFHARYPGYEWDQALDDARGTEVRTGLATKIIRDTYDRDRGISEETVAYQSPNAKKSGGKNQSAQAGQASGRTPRGGKSSRAGAAGASGANSLTPVTDTMFFVRLILSLGASILIAGMLTILLNTVFNAVQNFGYQISSASASQILMYWFMAMLSLSAIALNKAYVPWRRMLAGHREPSVQAQRANPDPARASAPPVQLKLTAKPPSPELEAEREQAVQDMKMLRGDLDPLASQNAPENVEEPNALSSAEDPIDFSAGSAAGQEPDAAPELTSQPDKPVKPPETDETARDEQAQSDGHEAADDAKDAKDDKPQASLADMDMESLVMVRFMGDVVMSIRSAQGEMDGTMRFGISLYLAGAASTLADQHGLTPAKEKEILAEALELIGHSSAVRESFLAKYDENLNAKKNQKLIEAGEQDMLRHLRSNDGPAKDLGGLLDQWDQPSLKPEPKLGGVFLLTYTSIPQSALPDAVHQAMDRHNRGVRHVLADCSGAEVRHTGKGIFAHFDHPDDAICAAISIQQAYEGQKTSAEPMPPARVSLVATLNTGPESDISGEIFHAADTLCRRITDLQIAADVRLGNACTIPDVTFGRDIPHAHSGIADGPQAMELEWQPLAETL